MTYYDKDSITRIAEILEHIPTYSQLTKREQFAAFAMQGLFSNPWATQTNTLSELVVKAVQKADEFIEALDAPIPQSTKPATL